MPSESLADLKQKDWIRACPKLGLEIDAKRGKGSHILVKHPTTGAKYTVQNDLHKLINMKIFKKLQEWGFTEETIWNALR